MAEINDFIDPKAEAQVQKYLQSLQQIAESYNKIFDSSVKVEQSITTTNKTVKDSTTKQTESNKAAQEAAKLAREQEKALKELEKARQKELDLLAKQEAKEKAFQQAMEMEAKTINEMVLQNKALRQARNDVDTTTEKGIQRLAELNSKIDQNSKNIKLNTDAATKQAMNIGNYSSVWDKFKGQIGGVTSSMADMPGPLGTAASGVMGLGKQLWALVLNPIVAIVAGIVLAFTALYKVFSSTGEGAAKIDAILASLSVIMDVLKRRALILIDAFSALFHGRFKDAGQKFGETVSGLGDEMSKATGRAYDLSLALTDLEHRMTANISKTADYQNKIAKLMNASVDKTLSKDQRISSLQQALSLEKELS